MIQCSFEETINLPGGGFRATTCIQPAEIMFINDPCFGLCFRCAYRKLKTENEILHYGCQDQTAISLIHKAKVNKAVGT
ncbi:hypothetical protein LCGC14_1342280 [marine sediment metagenome]|uniref:Uncharacterized protein n=1 Tax=marine sediment metagenome TaxID=412755 RepID=A0A0F9KD74_9ZZZZ